MTDLLVAIEAAHRKRRGQVQSGWGVVSSNPREGLITVWPSEDEANAEAERLNGISRKESFRVRYHVVWVNP